MSSAPSSGGCRSGNRGTGSLTGLAVQVSAELLRGLAAREDDRYRLAATAEAGSGCSAHPAPGAADGPGRAGTTPTREQAASSVPAGSSSRRAPPDPGVPVADPGLVRRLDVGQVAYLYRGGATFTQVKRLVGRAPLGAAGRPSGRATVGKPRRGWCCPMRTARPDVTALPTSRLCWTSISAGTVMTPFELLGLPRVMPVTDDDVRRACARQPRLLIRTGRRRDPAAFAAAGAAYTALHTRAARRGDGRTQRPGVAGTCVGIVPGGGPSWLSGRPARCPAAAQRWPAPSRWSPPAGRPRPPVSLLGALTCTFPDRTADVTGGGATRPGQGMSG